MIWFLYNYRADLVSLSKSKVPKLQKTVWFLYNYRADLVSLSKSKVPKLQEIDLVPIKLSCRFGIALESLVKYQNCRKLSGSYIIIVQIWYQVRSGERVLEGLVMDLRKVPKLQKNDLIPIKLSCKFGMVGFALEAVSN